MRLLAAAGTVLALAGSAAAGTPGFARSVLAPDGAVRYTAVQAKSGTTVAAVRVRDGKILRAGRIAGEFHVARVAYDGSAAGVSGDGSTLVLAGPTRNVTRFAILSTKTFRPERLVTLRGEFTFDAVSPSGDTVYLIEYLGEPNYRVRAYDVETGGLIGRVIVDKSEPGPMQGTPLTRADGAGGSWAYTLYGRGGDTAFVHALDTEHRGARCIDLPWRLGRADRATLRVEGDELVVRRHGRRLGAIDLTTLKVRR